MDDRNLKRSLREMADNYGMDAPEGLWEDIERKVRGRMFIRRFVRIGAAAAAALVLLAGLGVGLSRQSHEDDSLLAEVPVSSVQPAQEDAHFSAMTADATPGGSSSEGASLRRSAGNSSPVEAEGRRAQKENTARTLSSAKDRAGEGEIGSEEELAAETGSDEELAPEETGKEELAPEAGREKSVERKDAAGAAPQPENARLEDNDYYRDAFREDDLRRRHRAGGLSLRLLTANSAGVSLSGGGMGNDAFADAAPKDLVPSAGENPGSSANGDIAYSGDKTEDILIANLNDKVTSDVHHQQPLTFAVRAAYPLTGRLSVESGLDYTLLRSSFNYGGSKAYEQTDQTLHYLGIPLNLNYIALSFRRLDIGVSVGVMAEKCVYGKAVTDFVMGSHKERTTHTLSVKGLQWSSGVSLSLQYNLARRVGLFMEPGLRYRYGTDRNTEVRSSYTQEPLRFSVAVGARVNI